MQYGRVFHYYWPQVKKYKWPFFLTFVSYAFGIVFSSILSPVLYKDIVDVISTSAPNTETARTILGIFYQLVIYYLFLNIGYRGGDYLMSYAQANIMREISNDTFNRLMNHSYKFFSNNFSGSLVAKAKRFTASFERIHDVASFSLWFILVEIVGVSTVLMLNIPQIGALFLGWFLIYILITFLFIRKKIKYDLLEAAADSKVTARLADAITNVLNIKIFSGKGKEFFSFKGTTRAEYQSRINSWNFGNLQNMVQGLMMVGFELLVIYIMIKLWISGALTTGTFVLVQFYMAHTFHQIWELGKSLVRVFKSLADAKEMTDILDQTIDIHDVAKPEVCKISVGAVSFQNVDFHYIHDLKIFENFNLKIRAGEKIGLVGHSGSGKSTITKILLRFMDIQSGEILIDGQNIAKIKQDDLRDSISYVPQEPLLFHRSIRENILYSRPDAKEEEVIDVAKKAHAHEFITKLPRGYDTLVGERGVKLSGGERQRVAIARAMLKNAPIIILDEATSSLDSVSESYIQDAFNELMKGKTSIVIAHRLSTVQKMDRIVVLDKGKIVEEGTHHELLAKNAVYADLWNHQTGGFLE